MNVAGAAGGILAGLIVAGASFAALGIGAAVLTVPYFVVLFRAARVTPVNATGAAS
jgi:hypothetical protein